MKLIFATGNPNKIKEVAEILDDNSNFEIIPMSNLGLTEDIPETKPTLEGNALQKARYLHNRYQVNCFSEDTGLEIDSLGGEPGVMTARYAGASKNANANMNLVIEKLSGKENRTKTIKQLLNDL